MKNVQLKQRAIVLRKQGKSYSEILKTIPIAKSTLGLWLKDVGLSTSQKQRLTQKRLEAAKRGGAAKRTERLSTTKLIADKAMNEIRDISQRELFLIGVALYWAEGSKQKTYNPSARVAFSNSDGAMISVFVRWLHLINVHEKDISFDIYLHETSKSRTNEVRQYWSKTLKLSITKLEKIYYKKSKITAFRRNTGPAYYGLIRVNIARSTDLNRQINGWVAGICSSVK